MKRLLFLLIVLLVVPSFGGFYFDFTLGGSLRHLEAIQEHPALDKSGSGCHFEPDGRYVCGSKSSSGTSEGRETDIGYTGGGPLLGVRLGALINGAVAFFSNFEVEVTRGKISGENDDYQAKPRSAFIGWGLGVVIYPCFDSEGMMKDFYVGGTGNLLLGGGGGIGLFGVNFGLECGYLIPVSERVNVGFAAGADVVSTSGLDAHIKDESGYSVWIGLKFVRK